MEAGRAPARARIALAVGAATLLAAVVAGTVVFGDGDEGERIARPPPPECVRAWNADRAATAYGRHNFNFHRYEGALVTYLTPAADEAATATDGACAVVFPAQALDAEPFAAGQVLRKRRWIPISSLDGIELSRVGELQLLAAGDPNAALEDSGRLTEL